MSTRSTGGVIGACPTIEEPFEAADGRLVRLRVPGGLLSNRQARAAAEAAMLGNGVIEITSRANLQLRGFSLDALTAIAPALNESFAARTDVMTSPTAGVDRAEVVDTTPLVAGLGEALAGQGPLSPKLAVLVDGGGEVHVRGRPCDVGLGALRLTDGTAAFELRVGEALPLVVDLDDELAVVALERAVEAVLAVVRQLGPSGRASELVADRGRTLLLAGLPVERCRVRHVHRPSGPSLPPVGLLAQTDEALVSVGSAPLLGRLDPTRLTALAELAARHGKGELRLTPWRGVVLPSVSRSAARAVVDALEDGGLVCAPNDPALSVIACAGRTGCGAGLADTQADALAVIAHLRGSPAAGRRATVHLSGCPKRCASRSPDELLLLAGPEPDTYLAHRGTGDPLTTTGAGAVASLVATEATR